MPIEIRELVIRTVVGGGPQAEASSPLRGAPGQGASPAVLGAEQTELLVQECVRQVMLALQRERER